MKCNLTFLQTFSLAATLDINLPCYAGHTNYHLTVIFIIFITITTYNNNNTNNYMDINLSCKDVSLTSLLS